MTDVGHEKQGQVEDVRAIRDVIADNETGFNTNDAELSVAHFTDDAWGVAVTGVRVAGRPALLAAHRAGLAGPLRDQYARYRVGEVNFLRPDVAIAQKYATATDPDGRPIKLDHAMIALYVLVKEGDHWRVAARQNTLVAR
jgi:uncharacterized protein (TIGR02246 family)